MIGRVRTLALAAIASVMVSACGGSASQSASPTSPQPTTPPPTATPTQAATPQPTPEVTSTPAPATAAPGTGTFKSTGSMIEARNGQTATRLTNGKVLIVGGETGTEGEKIAELYDPKTGQFTKTGSLITAREQHTATLLKDGRVLIAGGLSTAGIALNAGTTQTRVREYSRLPEGRPTTPKSQHLSTDAWASAEIYDPKTGKFTATGSMKVARSGHVATLLPNGRVLVAGGEDGSMNALASAEIYNPKTGKFSAASPLHEARSYADSLVLSDGRLLVAGGSFLKDGNLQPLSDAEIYDPKTGKFGQPMPFSASVTSMTLLADGRILALVDSGSAEIFDPASLKSTVAGHTVAPRIGPALTLLTSGKVLVTGGEAPESNPTESLVSAEIYDPATGRFTLTSSMTTSRLGQMTIVLKNGLVLILGGDTFGLTAELFTPGS